jgi:hypothetical protein
MLAKGVLHYVAAIYGILVRAILPLIYLYSKVYFRNNRFGCRVMIKYLGKLLIIFVLYGIIVAALFTSIEKFGSKDSFNLIFDSPWYFVGFFVGLIGAILLCKIGFKHAQNSGQSK